MFLFVLIIKFFPFKVSLSFPSIKVSVRITTLIQSLLLFFLSLILLVNTLPHCIPFITMPLPLTPHHVLLLHQFTPFFLSFIRLYPLIRPPFSVSAKCNSIILTYTLIPTPSFPLYPPYNTHTPSLLYSSIPTHPQSSSVTFCLMHPHSIVTHPYTFL